MGNETPVILTKWRKVILVVAGYVIPMSVDPIAVRLGWGLAGRIIADVVCALAVFLLITAHFTYHPIKHKDTALQNTIRGAGNRSSGAMP